MEDLCVSQPCKNEGTCNLSNDGYKCLCPTGVKGTNCEEGKSNSLAGISGLQPFLRDSNDKTLAAMLDDRNNKVYYNSFVNGDALWRR